MKVTLGINFGHDSAACLIKDGIIVKAIEEEKMSRVKQDIGWPRHAIDRILIEEKIKCEEVNIISLEDVFPTQLGKYEILYRFTKNKFYKYLEYFDRIFQFLFNHERINKESNLKLIEKLIKKQGFKSAKLEYHDHHKSHAASAFYTAPFISDLVITSDGRGGLYSFNFYNIKNNGLNLLHSNSYKESVGVFYSNVTEILGFRANRHEGKITGLAAFGKKTELISNFKSLFKKTENGLSRYPFDDDVSNKWLKSKIKKSLSLLDKINLTTSSSSLSKDYGMRNLLLKEKMQNMCIGFSKEDIAYACQKIAEDVTIDEFLRICEIYNLSSINVSLAGGVFANVRLNQLIYETREVDNIYIHPAMNDSGIALGNAILSDLNFSKKSLLNNSYKIQHTLLGANYEKEFLNFIKKFNHPGITLKKMKSPASDIAKLLHDNKIIGLWHNSMEWGPRALGSRSIILNTFDKKVNQSLNDRLNRTEFMPFAPVVLDYKAKEYFPKYDNNVPAAKYMTLTYDTKEQYHELLQATVHVDGTARPQVIEKVDSSLYYEILVEFEKLSDCGALVNTSFNAHEEPILSSPETAVNALVKNRVDFLVMENYLLSNK